MSQAVDSSLPTWVSLNGLGVYVAIHVLSFYFFIKVRNKYIINANKEISKQFAPWEIHDVEKWSIVKQFPFYITFWPRFITILLVVFIYCTLVILFSIGHKSGAPMGKFRRLLIKKSG